MKKFFLVAVTLFSGLAMAQCPSGPSKTEPQPQPTGRFVQCYSADHKVAARVWLDGTYAGSGIKAVVYKQDRHLPHYWIGCSASEKGTIWLTCSHDSNRTLIVNRDYTARYIGSHKTHELTCTLQ